MEIIPIYVAHGVNYAAPEEKALMIENLMQHLNKYF